MKEFIKTKPTRNIPGPSASISLKYARKLQKDVLGLSAELKQEFGGIAKIPIPGRQLLLVSDADLVHDILLRTEQDFQKGPQNIGFEPLLGKGLVLSNGSHWRRQRRLMNPFFTPATIRDFEAHIQSAIADSIHSWNEDSGIIDLHREMQSLTLKIILRSLFSGEATEQSEELFHCFDLMSRFCIRRFFAPFPLPLSLAYFLAPAARKAHRRLEEILKELIQNRRPRTELPQDLLSMLILARDEETGEQMSDEQIRDELMTLFFAGYDTTSFGLTMTGWLLSQNPEFQEDLRNQCSSIRGDIASEEESRRIVGLRYAFQESLRIYPPVYMVNRTPIHDTEVGGFLLPAGSLLLLSIWDIHRSADYWENPLDFRPQRFSDTGEAAQRRLHYIPFGGGSRACLGQNLSIMEGTMILGSILKHFRLRPVANYRPEIMTGATLSLKNGMPMRIEPITD